jgi:hypothetical protein
MPNIIGRFGALKPRGFYIVVGVTFLLGLATMSSGGDRWLPCPPFSPPLPPEPVLVGYLTNGERTVQTTPPPVPFNEVGVLTRDADSNGISIDNGPQWNGRFRSSVLPKSTRFVWRFTTGTTLPSETPTIFIPLAGSRHVSYAPAGVDVANGVVVVPFEVDRLGADLLTSSMMAPGGVQGLALFPLSKKVIELRASLLEPHFLLATLSKRDYGCSGTELIIRSEVEYAVCVKSLCYQTKSGKVTVCLDTVVKPWQSLGIVLSPDFASAKPGAVELDVRPIIAAPTQLQPSDGGTAACSEQQWPQEWEFLYRAQGKAGQSPGVGAKAIYAQLLGFRGFRFEETGGLVKATIPDSSFFIPFGDEAQSVKWVADGEACFGYGYRTRAGEIIILLRMTRLAFRYGTQQQLLLAGEDGRPLVNLPKLTSAHDLDYGFADAIPYEAATIRVVTQQAAVLAKSEIARLGIDRRVQPLAAKAIEAEQRRLAPYLAAPTPPP